MEREAKVRIGGDVTGLNRALARSKGDLGKWARSVKTDVGGALRGAFSGLSTVAGFTGVGGMALALRETKLWNDRLVALQQTTGMTRSRIMEMNAQIQASAVATGASQENILSGIERYQELTGKVEDFTSALGDMTMVSNATGSSMADVAGMAASMSLQMGISSGELMKAFDISASAASRGAVEMKDMAALYPQILAAASRFATKGTPGLAEATAMVQVIRHGTADASEAATQYVDLMAGIQNHAKELEKHGINIFTDASKTQMRDGLSIIDEVNAKIKRADVTDVFGKRKEILFAYDSVVKYRTELGQLATTEDKTGDIVRKNADYMASSTAQFAIALASLKKAANDLLMGALPKLAAAFGQIVAALRWMVDHQAGVIATFAAWKLGAPMMGFALSGAKVGSALGGATGALGVQQVYVVNMGAGGMGGPGGVGGVVGGKGGGPSVLQWIGGTVGAFTIGYATGTWIAQGLGLFNNGARHDINAFHKYGEFASDQLDEPSADVQDKFSASPFGVGDPSLLRDAVGSARDFYPKAKDAGENETANEYAKRQRAKIDAETDAKKLVGQVDQMVAKIKADVNNQQAAPAARAMAELIAPKMDLLAKAITENTRVLIHGAPSWPKPIGHVSSKAVTDLFKNLIDRRRSP